MPGSFPKIYGTAEQVAETLVFRLQRGTASQPCRKVCENAVRRGWKPRPFKAPVAEAKLFSASCEAVPLQNFDPINRRGHQFWTGVISHQESSEPSASGASYKDVSLWALPYLGGYRRSPSNLVSTI